MKHNIYYGTINIRVCLSVATLVSSIVIRLKRENSRRRSLHLYFLTSLKKLPLAKYNTCK